MIALSGGRFLMGAPHADRPDARAVHEVVLSPCWLDETLVTNDAFARFVIATDYRTTAERTGSGRVFDVDAKQWKTVAGADWRHPEGPNSSIAARGEWPVVQVSWHDAVAYARWANKRLPSEAELEYAARSGLVDVDYPWGRELAPAGKPSANAWQGRFPHFNQNRDGYHTTSPVRAFPPNRFGLYDVVGNVWCWCSDWYNAQYYDRNDRDDPRGPATGTLKVLRGGSWQSTDNHQPLAVWRRHAAAPSQTTNHVGFRCARDWE